MRDLAHGLVWFTLLAALPAASEIYRWVDADGSLHFTQDLGEVPAAHREQARERSGASGGGHYQQVEGVGGSSDPQAPPASHAPGRQVYEIRVQRAGNSLLVPVRLNNSVTAPFIIDTGASDVVIPKAVADELGLGEGSATRTQVYNTANGQVEQPVVSLRSVQLAGATVENVPASISSSMTMGLLGLSFFNHFTYQIDAAAGVVTLERNDLVETGGIRGGRSEAQWRSEFANLRMRIATIDEERQRTPSSRGRKLRELAQARAELEKQLEALETEAYTAHAPVSWRE